MANKNKSAVSFYVVNTLRTFQGKTEKVSYLATSLDDAQNIKPYDDRKILSITLVPSAKLEKLIPVMKEYNTLESCVFKLNTPSTRAGVQKVQSGLYKKMQKLLGVSIFILNGDAQRFISEYEEQIVSDYEENTYGESKDSAMVLGIVLGTT